MSLSYMKPHLKNKKIPLKSKQENESKMKPTHLKQVLREMIVYVGKEPALVSNNTVSAGLDRANRIKDVWNEVARKEGSVWRLVPDSVFQSKVMSFSLKSERPEK